MLERGGDYRHIRDYDDRSVFEYPHRGLPTISSGGMRSDITGWMFNETVMESWVDETKEGKYTESKPFRWVRAYRLGGRSTMWGRQSYRLCEMDFEANAKENVGVDWPVRYKDIAPWYDHVERFSGISGSKEELDILPDGEFQPPFELNIAEKKAAEQLRKAFADRRLIIGRVANLTTPLTGRVNCQFRNRCWHGCQFGAYFSTQSSTLPAAAATGNLSVAVNALVTRILYNKDTQRATGVEVLDTSTNKTYEYKSKIVFICASALNSAWILMNSATDIWPDGLGSSSGELGHNIMDHHYNIGAYGEFPGFEIYKEYGRRPTGFYIPRFANVGKDQRNYLRGFGYQGGASRQSWNRGANMAGMGKSFIEEISREGSWTIGMGAFGEVLPDHRNKISLHPTERDAWGLPVLNMDAEIRENELAMRKDMLEEAKAMLEYMGAKNIGGNDGGHEMGHGIHEMGSARMGRDPKTSVLNGYNQVWDAPNVFVTDGAFMTSSSCVNPSLTYMAFTARATHYAVDQLNKQNL